MAFLRLTLIGLIFLLTRCSSDEPRTDRRIELIAGNDSFGKTWQIDRIEIEIGTVLPHRCVTDNFITYFPSGRYEINEGASKCNPEDPPGKQGTWFLNDDENVLTVQVGDSTQLWNINFLSSDSHSITGSFKEGSRTYELVLSK